MMKQNAFLVFLIVTVFQLSATAQEEFADLSSKERISIAEQEESEAKKDAEFQKTMREGHELFMQKHYLKAIRKYEKAQERRPYNVYPKVIISDIELSMADTLATLRAAEQLELPKETPEVIEPQTPEPEQQEVKPESDPNKRIDEWEKQERERRQREREAREREAKAREMEKANTEGLETLSIEDYQKELGSKFPNGITETTSKEGNKTITTRIVVKDGKGNEYKKVTHNWGGVFYFKNGEAVTERVWKQETEK
jgi:hypothetical protein